MQLQRRLAEFEAAETAVLGLSYDPVDVLARFAAGHGITFPLLSDLGSVEIRRLGLLNRHLADSAAIYGKAVKDHDLGLPYPGTFILDRDGRVERKAFEPGYRVRPAPDSLLAAIGAPPRAARVSDTGATGDLAATAWASQPFLYPYERLEIHLEIAIRDGLHVYGRPIPAGFIPLEVRIAPLDGLVVGPLGLPAPRPFRVAGIDEAFMVHEGTIAARLEVEMAAPPASVPLEIRIDYQACSETVCHPPAGLVLRLPLEGRDSIREPG